MPTVTLLSDHGSTSPATFITAVVSGQVGEGKKSRKQWEECHRVCLCHTICVSPRELGKKAAFLPLQERFNY